MHTSSPAEQAVQAVLLAEERRRQALLAADVAALQALLADDLTYVHSTAVCDSKDSFLAKLRSGSLHYLSLALEGVSARPVGGCMLVTGRMSAEVGHPGQSRQVSSLYTGLWACQPAPGADAASAPPRWLLHAFQGTPLPTGKTAP